MEESKLSVVTTSREKSHILISDLFKSTFGDLSNLDKTSFNAWAVERLTDIQRDLAVSMTLEKEEQFLNTCKNISTARLIGYNYNFNSLNAYPAIGMISFKMALPNSFMNQTVTIKADTTKLVAGDIQYLFPGDIDIVSDAKGNIQAVRRTEHIFDPLDNKILYSTSISDLENNQVIFAFSSEVIQLDYDENIFIVENHSQMTNSIIELEYNDNFYKIELWYEYYDTELTKTVSQYLEQVDELVGYNSYSEIFTVEVSDENKIRITLGDGINGKYYAGGKEINYRIYTTKGSSGNTINPSITVGVGMELNDISVNASFISDPIGGKDEYTLLELKDAIRKKIQTPGTIITDTDLKNNLSDILGLTSEETFHKLRRNDPIERILELFLIVKDKTSENNSVVIPTNTLDVEVDLNNIGYTAYNTIKPFFLVESYNMDDNGTTKRVNRIVPSYKTKSPDNMYYSSYYAIKVQEKPLLVNFFNLSTNYSLNYENTYVNRDQVEEVYINELILERDIFNTSNQYFMRMTLDSLNRNFLKDNTLIIKARFTNIKNDQNYGDFIIDFTRSVDEQGNLSDNIYEAKFTSLDIFSNSNNLFIKDVYKLEQTFTDATEQWSINTNDYETEMVDNVSCEICIFHNFDTGEIISNKSFQNVRGVRTLLLMSSYTVSDINFYQNIDEVFYSPAERSENKDSTIIISDLPLFKDDYIDNYNNRNALIKQMDIEMSLKSKLDNKLEFPSRLSLKYFNTYGYSNLYSSLENVSLLLDFEVSYKNNKPISSSEETEIKDNLIKFIDSINKKDSTEDKNIYLSDLVAIVKNNPNIVQCRVLNYSDNIFYQKNASKEFTFIPASLQLDASNIIFTVKSI